MSTPTVIANMALSHNKCENIASIDATDTKEAITCKQFYSIAKDYMLEKHPYGFIERRVALAPVAGVDPSDYSTYTYAYALPGDCLVAEEIYNSTSNKATDKIPFILGTNAARDTTYIFTDQEDAYLIYTASTDSFTSMRSATFQLALSYTLAWLIAMQLTGDSKLRDENLNMSFGITKEAETKDANEEFEDLEDFNDYADEMK